MLYSFMASSILALRNGIEAVRQTLPMRFSWPFFLFGMVLLAVPVLDIIRQVLSRSK